MLALGEKKFSGFFLRKLSPAARTLEQLRHHALDHHSPQFIDTAHQPVFYMRIQNGFDGHIEKIHHLLLIRSLFAKIICQLQKIISIVNPRLPGGQLHKMMLYADLIEIITCPSLIKSKASKYKRVSCCHERTVLPSRSLGKSGDLPPLSCEKDDPLVIIPYRHGRKYHSLYGNQITHFQISFLSYPKFLIRKSLSLQFLVTLTQSFRFTFASSIRSSS